MFRCKALLVLGFFGTLMAGIDGICYCIHYSISLCLLCVGLGVDLVVLIPFIKLNDFARFGNHRMGFACF